MKDRFLRGKMHARNLKVLIAFAIFLGVFMSVYSAPIGTKYDKGVTDENILIRDNEAADADPEKRNAEEVDGIPEDGLEKTKLLKYEMNGKTDELSDDGNWKNIILRIETQAKGDCVEDCKTDGDGLQAEFGDTTKRTLVCPGCADSEDSPPNRYDAGLILTFVIQCFAVLIVVWGSVVCVLATARCLRGKSQCLKSQCLKGQPCGTTGTIDKSPLVS